ncbi:MAG TPA: PQQ-dependent sugar dehydrogenase [Acidobacteriota bacterium]|nr:PQQ-dependent sugar dehydrogenase [Acidobacteriota bacterium]
MLTGLKKWGFLVLLFSFIASRSEAVHLQQVATISSPVAIAPSPDGTGRLFIVEQTGQIRILKGQQLLNQPFLDISNLISCCGERGLLGLAFHPNFTANGFFYVYYTNTAGNIVIARYKISSNPNVANRSSAFRILTIPHPNFSNHNGGSLQFGPDGFLYIGVGDGGSGGDPNNHGQSLSVLLGKILRIDVNHGIPYSVPISNPFVGVANARPEIWAFGLRNPWRFSFDRRNGDLFIGDVGQDSFEEVDWQLSTSHGGINYGWRIMEGRHCYNPAINCNSTGLKLPILEYSHANGCSITGGFRYRGTKIPTLVGHYIYGDFCSGQILHAKQVTGRWTTSVLLNTNLQISTFGQDNSGELYVADLGGAVYKIVN